MDSTFFSFLLALFDEGAGGHAARFCTLYFILPPLYGVLITYCVCVICTYTVNDEAKTLTFTIERCTFPQWDGGGHTVSIAFPTEDEFHFTFTKPFPDPTLGPIAPHIYFKRAPVPQVLPSTQSTQRQT